jgi:hypothetical protein
MSKHQQLESMTLQGRITRPENIAKSVLFFAMADSGFVAGEPLVVAGGAK